MHEIGTHVIDIQISENTTISLIYSNDLKITWNQVTISLCALGSASRLAQQSKTLPTMPSQHKTHLHWPRPRLSEQLTQMFTKGTHCRVPIQRFHGYFRDLNFDYVSAYFMHWVVLYVYWAK